VHATLTPLHTTADVADQVKVSDTTIGTTQEQQVEFLEIAPEEACLMPSPLKVDISYAETIRSFLTRPYPIYTGAWNGDMAQDTYILPALTTDNPLQHYLSLPFIRGKLAGFNYLRAGLRFEMRLNGTRFHYGQAVMGFHPLSNSYKSYNASQRSAEALTMFPSAIMDPGPSQIGVLEVPFAFPYHFWQLTASLGILDLGALHVKVLSPLRVVSNATVPLVEFNIYVSLVDPVLNAFSAFDTDVPVGLLEYQSLDSAARFVPENMNFLATTINDISVKTGMTGNNSVEKQENTIGIDRKDMSFSEIYKMPNYIQQSTWTSAATPGTPVMIVPVNPMYSPGPRTYLSHLAGINRFWRGSLRYHLRLVASGFHSGRVSIGWEPAVPAPLGSGLVFLTNRMSMLVDMQQTTDVYFTIPYMSTKPWLDAIGNGTQLSRSNGSIIISVVNGLATPDNEPTEVDLILWCYGSHDLEFAFPLLRPTTTGAPFSGSPALEMQCLKADLGDSKFGNITGSFSVPSAMVMGERLTTVRQLVQKMAPMTSRYYGTTTARASIKETVYSFGGSHNCHIKYLSSMYVGMRGAVRYASVAYTVETATTIPTIMLDQYEVGPTVLESAGTVISSTEEFGSLVVRPQTPNSIINVPFYTWATFIPTSNTTLVTSLIKPGVTTDVNAGPVIVRTYVGAGDDFMFGYLIPPTAS
jgi:hypothetical protein